MTFIQQFGHAFGTKRVTITPGSENPERQVAVFDALVQPKSIDFEVDVPVYEGDHLQWEDPRGGTRSTFATDVEVFDAGSRSLRHISVKYGAKAATPRSPASSGHVIVINGNHVNVALEGSTITQQVPVSAGYEALADAVGRALALIEQTQGVDPDEVDAARESATLVVQETAKPEPDQSIIKRLLPTIRGVLTSAANSGAGAAATALVTQLFV
jgi:hypothetical protein